MAFTNVNNLPLPILAALENEDHISQGSDLGAASVGQPVRQVALKKRHAHEIVVDITDRVWALFGQGLHVILERAGKDRNTARRRIDDAILLIESLAPEFSHAAIAGRDSEALDALYALRAHFASEPQPFRTFTEERWEMTVRGWKIAARCDSLVLDEHGLTDWKVSSVWALKDKVKPEWVAQLNVTALAGFHTHGFIPSALSTTVFARDWRPGELAKYRDYPPVMIGSMDVPAWTHDETQRYLEERVALHQAAVDQSVFDLPECTPAERWDHYDVYVGAKKLPGARYDTLPEAIARKKRESDRARITWEVPRCAQYCDVRAFCPLGQALVQQAKDFSG